ncbi:hypothetical protein EV193_101734 [Herbihabitans rhizosphaerae]|uniref:PASTA domain-containing protein n=1 Tax=Herbihabitans rhizosphaerae TaxID=1872711 RepID=A0A4Q7L6C4_9PSEU|nr:hypothetical protein [Herbihabitans rhizosphaerae]RZS44854.1 hypothetical protein EV193_101734 [Herbihabitans rhizosphaerae]
MVIGALTLAGCGQQESPTITPGGPSTTPTVTAVVKSGSAMLTGMVAAPVRMVMPNLVGRGLQEAQNAMQRAAGNPVFISFSHDATGAKRKQVLDSNWKVCAQNVAAGTPFTQDTRIDFAVVKLAERCP